MKKVIMKKAPPGAPDIQQYNEMIKAEDPDDPALDSWVDLVTKDAKQLAARERKRVAQALLEAAAALEGTTVPGDLIEALEMVQDDMQKAIALAKRGQFAKAQDALEGALSTGNVLLQEEMFRDADDAQKLEDRGGSGQPSWLQGAVTKMDIKLTYRSIDRVSKSARFKTLESAQKFAARYVGETPEIGRGYAVSGDGIGKITWVGCTSDQLFPKTAEHQPRQDDDYDHDPDEGRTEPRDHYYQTHPGDSDDDLDRRRW